MSLLHIDILSILPAAGYAGITLIAFAESGLFFGFFLPGDSMLFSAGLLAHSGIFNIALLVLLICTAAIAGDSVGYWFGALVGPRLFSREDSFFLNKKHLEEARRFYEHHGPSAILLARFVPVVRTFTPILAGVGQMRYSLFLHYNIFGGLLWGAGITLLGYFLGAAFPALEGYLTWVILAIVLVSMIPIALQWWRAKKQK